MDCKTKFTIPNTYTMMDWLPTYCWGAAKGQLCAWSMLTSVSQRLQTMIRLQESIMHSLGVTHTLDATNPRNETSPTHSVVLLLCCVFVSCKSSPVAVPTNLEITLNETDPKRQLGLPQ